MNVLTEALDNRLARSLLENKPHLDELTFQDWSQLCRICDDQKDRRRVIEITWDGGKRLESIAGMPALSMAMRLAEPPARLAGLGELYQIMRVGYDAFCLLPDVDAFLNTLVSREHEVLDRVWGSAQPSI